MPKIITFNKTFVESRYIVLNLIYQLYIDLFPKAQVSLPKTWAYIKLIRKRRRINALYDILAFIIKTMDTL